MSFSPRSRTKINLLPHDTENQENPSIKFTRIGLILFLKPARKTDMHSQTNTAGYMAIQITSTSG